MTQDATERHRGKGFAMHGFARFRLVGTAPVDGVDECGTEDLPESLPFPTCVRDFPTGGRGACAGARAMDALTRVNFSIEKLRDALESSQDEEGPRAA